MVGIEDTTKFYWATTAGGIMVTYGIIFLFGLFGFESHGLRGLTSLLIGGYIWYKNDFFYYILR